MKNIWNVKVAWTNPYTNPPNKDSKILFDKNFELKEYSGCCLFDSVFNNDRENIENLAKKNGYNISVSRIRDDEQPKRKLSEETLLIVRQKKTINRCRNLSPIFVDFLEQEFKKRKWVLENWHLDYFYNPPVKKISKLQIEKKKIAKENRLKLQALKRKKRKKVLVHENQLNLNDCEVNDEK